MSRHPILDATAFVSCTARDEESFSGTPLCRSLDRLECGNRKIFFANAEGMSVRYNEGMAWARSRGMERAVFAHDDLWILDAFLGEKLETGFGMFDVIGVAGATSFSISYGLDGPHKKVAWHICAPREHWSGAVEHPHVDKDTGKASRLMTYMSYFGPTPRRCATLDGLFLAIDLERCKDVDFDENFRFDFYDVSFCIRAHRAGLRIGTMNIHTMHESHGAGILAGSYLEAQEKFLGLYRRGPVAT